MHQTLGTVDGGLVWSGNLLNVVYGELSIFSSFGR
jgi:hypothetical protein